jgi:hypothetical protein
MVDRVLAPGLRLFTQRVAVCLPKPIETLFGLLVRIDPASACGVLTQVFYIGGVT